MLHLKNSQTWHWRNRVADHPVMVGRFVDDGATSGDGPRLGREALDAIRGRFPVVGPGDPTQAELLAAICLSLQQEKYDVPRVFGVARSLLWFAAIDPIYATVSLGSATAFLNELARRADLTAADLLAEIDRLESGCAFAAADYCTRAMVAEASRRGIPWSRLSMRVPDVRLGHGRQQLKLRGSTPSMEPARATQHAQDKSVALEMLSKAALPVGVFAAVELPERAVPAADAIGYPVVLKPALGSGGAGVIVGLTDAEAVRRTATALLQQSPSIVVQSILPGDDHRLLVVKGRLVSAVRRDPAAVVGDGVLSVGGLVEQVNSDPRRGPGHTKPLTRIEIDDEARRVLATQGLTVDSVPHAGRKVLTRLTANIATGGTSVNVTDVIHPDNVWLAERAAAVIGLTVAGVDFITPDIARSWREVGGGICEINTRADFRPHWLAEGSPDVVGPILDTMFAPGEDGRIPTALITGAHGKTTAAHMLDHILRAAGHVVGCASPDGVTIDGRFVAEGANTGPDGALLVLHDPMVGAAALVVARDGVINRGIALDRCTVAAVVNSTDVMGGAPSRESFEADRKVLGVASGAVVLNADDPACRDLADEFPVDRTILFSLDASAGSPSAHLEAGGTLVSLGGDNRADIVLLTDERVIPVVGATPFHDDVTNALAAVALAHGMKVPVETISAGLAAFLRSPEARG